MWSPARRGRADGWSWWGQAPAGWRRLGWRPSAATRWCCSRPATSPEGRFGSRPGSRAAARSSASSTGGSRAAACKSGPRLNTYAGAEDVLAEQPDVVVVATGGIPTTDFLDEGEDLVTTSWDLLTGMSKAAETVLVYDDNGAHPGMSAAEFAAEAGSRVEIVTPERTLAPDVGGTSYPAYFRSFARHGARISINLRLESVRRDGNALVARFFDEYGRTPCRAPRRPDRRRARNDAGRRTLLCPQAAVAQSWRSRLRSPGA